VGPSKIETCENENIEKKNGEGFSQTNENDMIKTTMRNFAIADDRKKKKQKTNDDIPFLNR
jgi:hypothetical protein